MATLDERTDPRKGTRCGHTGPSTLAGRYLRKFWHPVCGSRDLPPGRTAPIRILNDDLTLYRGQDGATHALAFRCAHRGTQLSTGGWKETTSGAATTAGCTIGRASCWQLLDSAEDGGGSMMRGKRHA